ncbi:MAG: HAD-IA family hydrolase [Anaerolineaceae bacterium]|nr:HAD-IA family hydrolase [Anaerolineaceae bacterium]
MIRVIVLDFDGLIVESEEIKDRAFVEAFPDHPEHREAIMAYHLQNKHLVRYEKFEHIATAMLGLPYGDEDRERIAARFSRYTRRRIAECPEVPGAREFLDHFQGKVPMYLVSATPQSELEPIIEDRGLAACFKRIFGAPRRKPDVLREVMTAESVAAEEMVMIGDSLADLHAAREVGALFVGRNRVDDFSACDCPHYDDLVGIRQYVAKRT